MTSKELIKFSIEQKWRKARVEFYKEQIETINKLTSMLSEEPKGNKQVYDKEAEKLSQLLDQINKLIDDINNNVIEMEKEIKEQLSLLKPKYGLLLYHYYVLGDSMKEISKETLHYGEKYLYDIKTEAEKEFNKIQEKKG